MRQVQSYYLKLKAHLLVRGIFAEEKVKTTVEFRGEPMARIIGLVLDFGHLRSGTALWY